MTDYPITSRNRVRRLAKRASYDEATVHAIIDEALVCHVAFVDDGMPMMIPTLHARRGGTVLLHGAKASRLLAHAAAGHPLAITMTLVDGIVLARSTFHHSMNYRSVVLFGTGTPVEGRAEKLAAMQAFTDHLVPGRWGDARVPNDKELNATAVVAVDIAMASAKVRTGPAIDEDEDYALPVWAGLLPIAQTYGPPLPDERLATAVPLPAYVRDYRRR